MWNSITEILQPDRVIRYQILDREEKVISFREVIDLWKSSESFRGFYTDLLRESPFEACFWEVKPVLADTLDEPFEFVMIQSGLLAGVRADPSPFSEHWRGEAEVVSFPNLGGDALLVVPAPVEGPEIYGHLLSFLRGAPAGQVDEFWYMVGEAFAESIGGEPRWLSTAGLGVDWLHVRIDSRPKYYRYRPYKEW